MTCDADARRDHEHHLFLAEFYPELGEHLAAQCAAGYDARAGRARFLAWLLAHAKETAIAEAEEATAEPEAVELQVAAEQIPGNFKRRTVVVSRSRSAAGADGTPRRLAAPASESVVRTRRRVCIIGIGNLPLR